MDQFNHNNKKQEPFNYSSMCNTMTTTFSEIDFDEFYKQSIGIDDDHGGDGVVFGDDDQKSFAAGGSPGVDVPYRNQETAPAQSLRIRFCTSDGKELYKLSGRTGACAKWELSQQRDNVNRFSSSGGMTGNPLWSQNLTPINSSVTVTMDSQSSICAESPTSDTKPQRRDNNVIGTTSDEEQSDYDQEIEAGQCEQSNDKVDVKRIKRMVSNRESAKRSRRRKQAQLTDLEQQVDKLRAEYSVLFKQLTSASHQYKDASTNNRVLKSEVEALRAKVKLAEDTLARGSLTSSLSHLLQNHLATPQLFNCQNMPRMGNVSPTITIRGDDHGPHPGLHVPGQHMMVGLGADPDIFSGNVNSGISSDGGSCVTEMWPHDAHSPI